MKENSVLLNDNMSNKVEFINSMFGNVRDPEQNGLYAALNAGKLYYPFADDASKGLILNAWLAAWQESQGDPYDTTAFGRCPTEDKALIAFLAEYLKENAIQLSVPSITLAGISEHLPVYKNNGYDRNPFYADGVWRYGTFDGHGNITSGKAESTVVQFLKLFFFGAHMVVVISSKDRNGGKSPTDFQELLKSKLETGKNLGNSHYTSLLNVTGVYYLNLTFSDHGEAMPTKSGREPLILSFLVARTAQSYANDFIQIEGWPAQFPFGGKRHSADYESHEETMWNIATYGACAFSEKRCTPVFLADGSFDLTMHDDTGMPYYWGANHGNRNDRWLKQARKLIEI